MTFLNQLKNLWQTSSAEPSEEVNVLRNIISKVEELPPERARFIACFAFLLGRVAYSDLSTSEEEVSRIEGLLTQKFNIELSQAVLICKMAKTQNELFGSTENYLVAREFKEVSSVQERRELIDFLFQVAASDESISSAEEAEISQMASELEIDKQTLIEIRQKYREHRSVLRS